MKIRMPNMQKVSAFVRRVEERRRAGENEAMLSKLTPPRLEHVYKERGTKATLEFALKTHYSSGKDNKHWSYKR